MKQPALALAVVVLVTACSSESASQSGAGVRQGAANASFAPAFANQTRAPEDISGVTIDAREVARGLSHPWAVALLPDGRLLVTERVGRLRIVTEEGAMSPPIAGLPAVDARAQGGLLDVALSPSFAADRLLYWSFAEPRDGGANATAVARGRLSDDETRIENAQVIFRQSPPWRSTGHYGSRLVFDREGRLYVTLGDRQSDDSRPLAQDLSVTIGKVVRILPDGAIPADNPFTARTGVAPEIWSYGHRNVQGAALHPQTGALWAVEHGPRGGDELNVLQAGGNFGWPLVSYGIEYRGGAVGEGQAVREGTEQPIYYWDPVIAPGGMAFYGGDLFPWRGDLLIAGLRDRSLVRLELNGQRVVGEERFTLDIGRIRDVAEAPDGALWIVTDEDDGGLYRLTPRS